MCARNVLEEEIWSRRSFNTPLLVTQVAEGKKKGKKDVKRVVMPLAEALATLGEVLLPSLPSFSIT
jgi:hypothetical protein